MSDTIKLSVAVSGTFKGSAISKSLSQPSTLVGRQFYGAAITVAASSTYSHDFGVIGLSKSTYLIRNAGTVAIDVAIDTGNTLICTLNPGDITVLPNITGGSPFYFVNSAGTKGLLEASVFATS